MDTGGFDMEQYIRTRMMEIAPLEDRAAYKEIVGKLLLELYRYNQETYDRLEEKILRESIPGQGSYAVYMGLTDKKNYDATDTFLYPLREEDPGKREISAKAVNEAVKAGESILLYTVFLPVKASAIYRLLSENREFSGVICTDKRQYRAMFTLRRGRNYLDRIKELYYIFAANSRPWTTVCEAYLMKMLDVYLLTAEKIPEKDTILEIQVDFEEYADIVQYDRIPLWNLKKVREKTSTYPEPCIDKINYEHRIFAHRLNPDYEYLVADTDVEITNVRRVDGDLLITCTLDAPYEWELYRIGREEEKGHYDYPVLGNRCKDSFSGELTELYRRSIKTRGEMARLIEAFNYDGYITFKGVEICGQPPERWEGANYNMDGFVRDEIRVGEAGGTLLLHFVPTFGESYLSEDIMSFFVTQVQKLFPEYLCVGKLDKES